MEFVKYVHTLRPRVFLLENVVGMLTAGDGILVAEMLAGFNRAGCEVDWRVMNDANFGTPRSASAFFFSVFGKILGPESCRSFLFPRIGL